MLITDLTSDYAEPAAELLVAAFSNTAPNAWRDIDSARETVREVLSAGNIARMALDDTAELLGWIGGESQYGGVVWELHPLVVSPAKQRRGIGRALVQDFEERVRERGGITILLGTDDENDLTTLSGVDLYADLWRRIREIRNLRNHPFEFYQKLGYVIVGVVPDANGIGKPDILMAKRVSAPKS